MGRKEIRRGKNIMELDVNWYAVVVFLSHTRTFCILPPKKNRVLVIYIFRKEKTRSESTERGAW